MLILAAVKKAAPNAIVTPQNSCRNTNFMSPSPIPLCINAPAMGCPVSPAHAETKKVAPRRTPISWTSFVICATKAGRMAAKQPRGRPKRAAKQTVGAAEEDKADGIHIANTRTDPNAVKRIAVLKRPRWSPAQGGKTRPTRLNNKEDVSE